MSDHSGEDLGLAPPAGGDDSEEEFDDSPPAPALPDGVRKEVLEPGLGASWKTPKAGDELTVHYVGTLEDGTQFDSSRDRGQPMTFTVGKGQVIKGWDLGIATMIKGEKARFTIQPEFAYGADGSPPAIPPSAVLIFEVELIGWVSKDDLFGDDGCIKALIQEGKESWNHPKRGSEVSLSVKATAQDGTLIEERCMIDYAVGSQALGALSSVVEKALQGMSKGERCELACAEDYVYKGSTHGRVKIDLELHEIYKTSDASLLKDSTVMKKTIKEGEGYEMPMDMDPVRLRVESATDGSTPLAGFSGPAELEFKCGGGEVCDALEGAAASMKRGERAVVTCTVPSKAVEPKLGLTEISAPTVVLCVELLDFTKGKEVWSLSDEEKVELAMARKDVAAQLFKAKRFELALTKYTKVLDAVGSQNDAHAELKRTIELNKAACYLLVNDPSNALSSCNKVLQEDRGNVKALFRRAKARHARSEHLEALQDLKRVLELDEGNSDAKALLPRVKRAQKLEDEASKNTYARMCGAFGKLGSGREDKPKEEEKASEPQAPEAAVVQEEEQPSEPQAPGAGAEAAAAAPA